jgi:hypothetical protein
MEISAGKQTKIFFFFLIVIPFIPDELHLGIGQAILQCDDKLNSSVKQEQHFFVFWHCMYEKQIIKFYEPVAKYTMPIILPKTANITFI